MIAHPIRARTDGGDAKASGAVSVMRGKLEARARAVNQTGRLVVAWSPCLGAPVNFPPHISHATVHLASPLACSLVLVLTACGAHAADPPAPIEPPARPLAPLVAQQVIVAPTHVLSEIDPMGWVARIPRSREYLRTIDSAIEREFAARGLDKQWVYPAALVRAMRANPSYSVDPYALSAGPLRSRDIVAGSPFAAPLATQLRTMVALQESARAVLLPVELRFDRTASGYGIAVLRVALLDGRLGDVRWIGDVKSDSSATFSGGLVTSLAAHVADLVTAP